jgi:hypothetical protein
MSRADRIQEDEIREHEIQDMLRRFADGFVFQRRSPIPHHLAEQGLDHEDITFPSSDGVPLEGWLIPAPDSDRLDGSRTPAHASTATWSSNATRSRSSTGCSRGPAEGMDAQSS